MRLSAMYGFKKKTAGEWSKKGYPGLFDSLKLASYFPLWVHYNRSLPRIISPHVSSEISDRSLQLIPDKISIGSNQSRYSLALEDDLTAANLHFRSESMTGFARNTQTWINSPLIFFIFPDRIFQDHVCWGSALVRDPSFMSPIQIFNLPHKNTT